MVLDILLRHPSNFAKGREGVVCSSKSAGMGKKACFHTPQRTLF